MDLGGSTAFFQAEFGGRFVSDFIFFIRTPRFIYRYSNMCILYGILLGPALDSCGTPDLRDEIRRARVVPTDLIVNTRACEIY